MRYIVVFIVGLATITILGFLTALVELKYQHDNPAVFNRTEFSEAIRNGRLKQKMGLKEAGDKTGINYCRLSELECGVKKPTKDEKTKLKDFYEM